MDSSSKRSLSQVGGEKTKDHNNQGRKTNINFSKYFPIGCRCTLCGVTISVVLMVVVIFGDLPADKELRGMPETIELIELME